MDILHEEIGLVFNEVLQDAGVYKCTPEGRKGVRTFYCGCLITFLGRGYPLRECFKYRFSQCDGRRRIFSFSRKIYKSALALISGSLRNIFYIMQLALFSECQSKL